MAIVDAFQGEGSAEDEKTEDITDQIDGDKTLFTALVNFKPNSLKVFRNGQRDIKVRTFTITSAKTFSLPTAPSIGEFLLIDYIPF